MPDTPIDLVGVALVGIVAASALLCVAVIAWWRHPPRSRWGRVLYWSVFGPLIVQGVYSGFGLAWIERQDGRMALGHGLSLAMVLWALTAILERLPQSRAASNAPGNAS